MSQKSDEKQSTINVRFTVTGEVRDFYSNLEGWLSEQLDINIERMTMDYTIVIKKD